MRRYIFLLTAIGLLLAQTLPTIVGGRFTFAFDMGRDLLWVRNMVELKKPALIGPWGSIAGVYFGPLWYYLLAIPYLIFSGDPRAAVSVPLAANLTAIIIGWLFLRRRQHRIAADIFALLYSASPMIVSLSSFAFHANLLPLTTLLFMIGLFNFHRSLFTVHRSLFSGLPLSALSASLAYHLEPAAGVMLTGFFGWTLIFNKLKISKYIRTPKLRSSAAWTKTTSRSKHTLGYSIIIGTLAFLIPFTPQIIFELRHNFIQTKSLIAYFQGENTSLGGVLPLNQRLTERIDKISGSLSYSLFPVPEIWQQWFILSAFLLLIIVIIKKYRPDHFSHHFLFLISYFLFFHYITYSFLFPAELKGWYLSGFASLFILTAALIIEKLFVSRRLIGISTVATFMLWNTNGFSKLIPKNNRLSDQETLANQLEIVDWIYQDGLKSGQPFSVYTYTPPIYDYSYQYLIWWQGAKRHGNLPAEFGYLPGETSYLPEKEKFISADWKPQEAKITYLIIEPDNLESRQQGWLGHFASTALVSKIDFPSGVTVEKRYQL